MRYSVFFIHFHLNRPFRNGTGWPALPASTIGIGWYGWLISTVQVLPGLALSMAGQLVELQPVDA